MNTTTPTSGAAGPVSSAQILKNRMDYLETHCKFLQANLDKLREENENLQMSLNAQLRYDTLSSRLDTLEAALDDANTKLAQRDAEIEALKDAQAATASEAGTSRQQLRQQAKQESKMKFKRITAQNEFLNKKLQEQKKEFEAFKDDKFQELDNQKNDLEERYAKKKHDLNELIEKLQMKAKSGELREIQEIQGLKGKLGEASEREKVLEKEVKALKKRVNGSKWKKNLDEATEREGALQEEISELKAQKEASKLENEQVIIALKSDLEASHNRESTLKDEKNDLDTKLEESRKIESTLKEENNGLISKLEEFKKVAEEAEETERLLAEEKQLSENKDLQIASLTADKAQFQTKFQNQEHVAGREHKLLRDERDKSKAESDQLRGKNGDLREQVDQMQVEIEKLPEDNKEFKSWAEVYFNAFSDECLTPCKDCGKVDGQDQEPLTESDTESGETPACDGELQESLTDENATPIEHEQVVQAESNEDTNIPASSTMDESQLAKGDETEETAEETTVLHRDELESANNREVSSTPTTAESEVGNNSEHSISVPGALDSKTTVSERSETEDNGTAQEVICAQGDETESAATETELFEIIENYLDRVELPAEVTLWHDSPYNSDVRSTGEVAVGGVGDGTCNSKKARVSRFWGKIVRFFCFKRDPRA